MPIGTMQVSPVRLWNLKQQDVFYILFLGGLQNGASAFSSEGSDLWVCLENGRLKISSQALCPLICVLYSLSYWGNSRT